MDSHPLEKEQNMFSEVNDWQTGLSSD